MDTVVAHTELMHNALPARCIQPGTAFSAVQASDGSPVIFSIGSDQSLYVINRDPDSLENAELDLSSAFQLSRSTSDFCPVIVDSAKSSWSFSDDLQSPINVQTVLDLCTTTVNGSPGLSALTQSAGDASSSSPAGTSGIRTVTNADGNDNLLIVGGGGMHYLRGEDSVLGQCGLPLAVLSTHSAYQSPQQFEVVQEAAGGSISVWVRTAAQDVCYQEYSYPTLTGAQQPPTPSTPIVPLLLRDAGGGEFSPVKVPGGGQHLVVAGVVDTQPPSPVTVPTMDEVVQFVSLTTRAELKTAAGLPLGGCAELISTSVPAELIVNGVRLTTTAAGGPGQPVWTDDAGTLTIILQGTAAATPTNCPVITLAPVPGSKTTFQGAPLLINPGAKMSDTTGKLSSVSELQNLRQKGTIPSHVSDDDLTKAAQAFSGLKQAAASMIAQGQVPSPSSQKPAPAPAAPTSPASIPAVPSPDTEVAVMKQNEITQPLVLMSIGGLIVHAFEDFWSLIKTGFDDTVSWGNVLVNVATQNMIWGLDNMASLQAASDGFFAQAQAMVEKLGPSSSSSSSNATGSGGLNLPTGLQGADVGTDATQKSQAADQQSSHASAAKSPAASFGQYQMQHGGASVQSQPQSPAASSGGEAPSSDDIWADIEKLFDDLHDGFAKLFSASSLSVGQLLEQLGVDVLANVIAISGAVGSKLIDVLGSLIRRLAAFITATIDIPVLSALYKLVSGGGGGGGGAPLTVLDAVCLVMAIPMTFAYKLLANESPTSISGIGYLTKQNIYLDDLQSLLASAGAPASDPTPSLLVLQPQPTEEALALNTTVSSNSSAEYKTTPTAMLELAATGTDTGGPTLEKDLGILKELAGLGTPIVQLLVFDLYTVPRWAKPDTGKPADDRMLSLALVQWPVQGSRAVGDRSAAGSAWRTATWLLGAVSMVAQQYGKTVKTAVQFWCGLLQLTTSIGNYVVVFGSSDEPATAANVATMVEDFVVAIGDLLAAIASGTNAAVPYITVPAIFFKNADFVLRIAETADGDVQKYTSGIDVKF
ncbi:hypothetical protein B0T24DRAFT_662948 [Lasiosphaeria ovina]|uniref:Uncharacterized protein n=1 Tax=Lasiosphaeria ovina TaxID=92902 RepID=A0AAE0NNC2_9PEZI|nr:hypothetical protein B0T24DRAFT_662948 [Lasiosphaeria ovina]